MTFRKQTPAFFGGQTDPTFFMVAGRINDHPVPIKNGPPLHVCVHEASGLADATPKAMAKAHTRCGEADFFDAVTGDFYTHKYLKFT
jgi:hypothetical protein